MKLEDDTCCALAVCTLDICACGVCRIPEWGRNFYYGFGGGLDFRGRALTMEFVVSVFPVLALFLLQG